MLLVLLVAAALRMVAFAEVPPGLYRDEAYHGLDALDLLRGNLSMYFPANNGREPLFIYLVTASVRLFGRSPFALRLPAFFVGLVTVAATAAMGRALFSRRVGLVSAAVLAVTLWHVHLSRVGFRAVLLPMLIALAVWQAVLAIRRRRVFHYVAAGVLYGLSFYTYTAARFTVVALAAFAVSVLLTRRAVFSTQLTRGLALAALAGMVTVLPLAVYTILRPDVALGRLGQVSVFNPAIHHGQFWLTLGQHVLRTLGMFFVRGDRIWRHNLPYRPVFDPILGVAFVVGVLVAARRARRDLVAGFALIWTAMMALPTVLAEDAPHFLRAVGMLPILSLLPALGLDWLVGWIASRVPTVDGGSRRSPVAGALLAAPLAFGLASTAWAYFGVYARNPVSGYWFEQGVVALAGRVNEFLGAGWDGGRMVWDGSEGRHVYLEPSLWDEWPQVRFLVPRTAALRLEWAGSQAGPPMAVFLWPYGDWQRAWDLLPTPAEIIVEEGALSQGDRDAEPYVTYLAFAALPTDQTSVALARFGDSIELLDVTVDPEDTDGIRVRLRWRAQASVSADYTVFVHYVRDGQRLAQADARPAGGRYPTVRWQAGDVINDDHWLAQVGSILPESDRVIIGLWQPESGIAVPVLDEAGNAAGDWVELPVAR
jgi:4-amino-4-deoxy-L-arabinose transferase-like glycosyltransferase